MGWWTDTKRAAGNVAAYGGAPLTMGVSLLGKQDIRDGVGNFLQDPAGAAGDAWNVASGAAATQDALKDQMQGAEQAGQSMKDAYAQGQGYLNPYIESGLQDYQTMRQGVQSGQFNPQYQGYQGPMTSGVQAPQFQGYQGQMSSGIQGSQFQGYGGPMSSGNQAPQFQGYQGPMSSGNNLPQYQQFQGQSQYQAGARPDRQAATAANVNMYMDPGYQFRLDQGMNAIQGSAAAKGLLGSSGTLNSIGEYAQGLASQEFGAAYGRQQQDQANRQSDFVSDRGFGADNFNQNFRNAYGMNQDANAWNAQNADRGQSWFEGDRAAGMNQNQFANNFGMQGAQFNQGAFEGDRAAGMNQNQFQNTWNMNNAQNQYGMAYDLANMGFNAAGQGANNAAQYGQSMADLHTGIGNARASARMTQSNQNRALFGDIVDLGFRGAAAYGGGG